MAAANAALLRTFTDLWLTRSNASVTIDSGRVCRTLHIQNGAFVGADSDVLTERLGVLLVADGKLDGALIEPIVQAARKTRRYFGDQIVSDGLVSGEDVVHALERQAHSRFDRSMQMTGEVHIGSLAQGRAIVSRSLPASVVASFRGRLPLDTATSLVATLPPSHARLRTDLFAVEELELLGSELRYWRQLESGQDASAVLDRAPEYEVAIRLIAALVGLGVISDQAPRDEVLQYLRTA